MTNVLAIDPGVNGAYAILDNGRFVACDELPRFDKMLNAPGFAQILRAHKPKKALMERVASRPGQGVAGVFTFGCAYGICLGVLGSLEIPLALVTPTRWKSHYRLTKLDKDASRELAIRLFPEAAPSLKLKKHHGRADALLMARYLLDLETGAQFA